MPRSIRSSMQPFRTFLLVLAALATLSGVASARQYKYTHVPRIVYVVGQPDWDKLPPGPGGKRVLTVYANLQAAQDAAPGATIYRVLRHTLDATPDGEAFLESTEQLRANRSIKQSDVLEFPLRDAASLEASVLKRAKAGATLGPVNPNWKTTGPYQFDTKPMDGQYLPGSNNDDYERGTWYFPTEGSPGAVDFINNYKVVFEKQPDGSVILKKASPKGGLEAIHTLDLNDATINVGGKAVKAPNGVIYMGGRDLQACLWVMDAEGNFFVLGSKWVAGIGDQGFLGINHSSLPSGHPVAAAGLMVVENGKLIAIDNSSGHYKPSNKMTTQAIRALEELHGIAKGNYKVSFGNNATDHPGRTYLVLDPNGEEKVRLNDIEKPSGPDPAEVVKAPVAEKIAPKPDDEKLIKPEEPAPTPPEREVDRLAREAPPEAAKLEPPKPVEPPDVAVIEALTETIKKATLDEINIEWMKKLYQTDPKAAKMIGQILGDPALQEKNLKMGGLRRTMDLMVWKKVLEAHPGLRIEITNQGKSNGARSDLDYTLYHLAEELGIKIQDLIAAHTTAWGEVHSGLKPEQFEITVMNGDKFYPDWRSEHLTAAQHQVEVRRVLGELRATPEAYSTLGGNKQQVHNNALLRGNTDVMQYTPELDKPGAPVEGIIVESGPTVDLALRYKETHPLYNHMLALGNAIQNTAEFFHHSGDLAQDAIRRAKYLNRVINEALGGLKFFANDYAAIHAGKVVYNNPKTRSQDQMKKDYLEKTLGLLKDDTGKPLLDNASLEKFKQVIDISMQIELDKTGTVKKDFMAQRKEYFKTYADQADKTIAERVQNEKLQPTPVEYGKMVLGEQERLFEMDQKQVLAEATLAVLRQSVTRDLSPEGVLRNRVRYDPGTKRFVIDDPEGAKKVAFERAVEVALFYELVNSLDDNDPEQMFRKRDMKKRALATAPSQELAEFYGALDQVNQAEVDKFIKGEAGNKIQVTIDELTSKQQKRALELLIAKKEAAIANARARGVAVDENAIAEQVVREHFMNKRLGLFGADNRATFWEAVKLSGPQLGKDFKAAFWEHGSAFMMGSTAVNLVRAYQAGGGKAFIRTAFTEAIYYMPGYIQGPFIAVDLIAKVREGQYYEAAKSGGLLLAMHKFPDLGWGLLMFNMASGTLDITRSYFVTRIDADMVEKALRSRPVDEQGNRLPYGTRARGNQRPDFTTRVGKGSAPFTPLFYGKYKNEKGLPRNPVIINGDRYADGNVPEDAMTDAELADSAGQMFGPEIFRELAEVNIEVGSPEWKQKVWELKLKFGFDVPFYKRVAKVFDEKYQYLEWIENYPNPWNPAYLAECREDVWRWYVDQPDAYKDELRGDFKFIYGDQTDKMQDMIARQCAVVFGSMQEMKLHGEQLNKENLLAYNEAMAKGFNAERALIAAKRGLIGGIETKERQAAESIEEKALEMANKHQTQFVMSYPFTYATEEVPPVLQFDARSIPTHVKTPIKGIDIDQEVLEAKEGAPSGWKPGKNYESLFKPDAEGWVSTRAVTADVKFTGHLRDADSVEVATATLTLPIVKYIPAFSGTIIVTVYGMGEKGDSTLYAQAEVTMNKDTRYTGGSEDRHAVRFERLKPGSYSVTVNPLKGDTYHGPGSGSGTIEDPFISKDPKATGSALVVVKLPYIPEKKIAEKPEDKQPGGNVAGGAGSGKTKDSTATGGGGAGGGAGGAGGAGGGKGGKGKDSTAVKGGKDTTNAGGGPTVDEIIANLTPLTSKAERARDDAKAACKFIEAAAAQQELVAAAKSFIATSFPKGVPGQVQTIAARFDAELVALKKAATAQEAANVHLRVGLAAVKAKQGEPALAALEAAANTPDIPQCLYDEVMKLYNEIKADIERRMKTIDKAVDAANNTCDFAAAQKFGEEVEAEDATLSWVVKELPRIKDLNKKQKSARALAQQAEQKALEADQAGAAGDKRQAVILYDQALALAQQALAVAPACEKDNLKSLLDLPARKAAVNNPKIDQSLILLLDTSGSMADGGKMESAKSAATNAVKSLGPTTEVALIRYSGGCAGGWSVVADFTTDRQPVISAIASLSPSGGTPTAPAIGFAHSYMQKNARSKSGQIILMTDGQNTCGSMTDAGAGVRTGNIPVRLDAVGFGLGDESGAQKDLGDLVRAAGNGNSYSANSAAELISAFRRAFIANQIKVRDPIVSGSAGTRLAELFAAAVEALKASDIRGAIGQFKSAADQFPASPAAQFNASLAYEAGGQPLQALNHANKYLQLAPNAFDAAQVRDRIGVLEQEQAANPRAIYTPTDCGTLYRWAQRESKLGGDATRKMKVFDILTTAQRGDCPAAQKAYDAYVQVYGKRP